jgi:hypothetical protein
MLDENFKSATGRRCNLEAVRELHGFSEATRSFLALCDADKDQGKTKVG